MCDAPARASLKCVISHMGHSACECCTDVGMYDHTARHVCLTEVGCQLRSDQSSRKTRSSTSQRNLTFSRVWSANGFVFCVGLLSFGMPRSNETTDDVLERKRLEKVCNFSVYLLIVYLKFRKFSLSLL